jgi:hypothetical protein
MWSLEPNKVYPHALFVGLYHKNIAISWQILFRIWVAECLALPIVHRIYI